MRKVNLLSSGELLPSCKKKKKLASLMKEAGGGRAGKKKTAVQSEDVRDEREEDSMHIYC